MVPEFMDEEFIVYDGYTFRVTGSEGCNPNETAFECCHDDDCFCEVHLNTESQTIHWSKYNQHNHQKQNPEALSRFIQKRIRKKFPNSSFSAPDPPSSDAVLVDVIELFDSDDTDIDESKHDEETAAGNSSADDPSIIAKPEPVTPVENVPDTPSSSTPDIKKEQKDEPHENELPKNESGPSESKLEEPQASSADEPVAQEHGVQTNEPQDDSDDSEELEGGLCISPFPSPEKDHGAKGDEEPMEGVVENNPSAAEPPAAPQAPKQNESSVSTPLNHMQKRKYPKRSKKCTEKVIVVNKRMAENLPSSVHFAEAHSHVLVKNSGVKHSVIIHFS